MMVMPMLWKFGALETLIVGLTILCGLITSAIPYLRYQLQRIRGGFVDRWARRGLMATGAYALLVVARIAPFPM